ncbi:MULTISPECIES: response regulator [Streptomyces]|uniref:Response regulator transcription factor n=1 Tax=Streptomyces acidicola TaxID=2596892 RepID=A0A5N8WRW7_9ACTN|nr:MULTISPECIES: response regulator transcription factor [Streptomyces]MBA2809104.1 response regulator transcription factor [Streptomyces sp. KM273126]MPY49882.1 response regulator transcription factor [Streptomyces acidicola]
MAVQVLIAEDHAVVRQGLRDFLSLDGDIAVAGETTNGREAVRLARELCPDVVLMELMMPVMDGIEATEQIRRELPEVRVVALTGVLDGGMVMAAVRAGATGFLLKNAEADELRHAVKAAATGRTYVSSAAVARLVDQVSGPTGPARLTERESEVLVMLARGKANKEIARDLHIGQQTVKTYVSHIFDKLGVHSRTQAVAHALRLGLVPPGELARGLVVNEEYRWSA